MTTPIAELISTADTEILRLNHAPSTLMQYRWAWHRFEVFCSENGITEFTDQALASYLRFLATELAAGRFKEWKYKLLRKSTPSRSAASRGSSGSRPRRSSSLRPWSR
ncbi:hypothetical protein BLJ79_17705 [Arthrobacter sp. UCD-GKA]|uniref:hypothetical protein n=1 Tax=Arthrobacter sp. UCD-GKA TaxID=1913576 RepID=UPI0008DDB878|nr:hypothetical protein [Arthrobacter sp. UCD-GKA]OIH82791.1 hypothetical protein BLJ79_17705 [Arthrobacter sp. UCD-GKA]